MGDEKTLTIKLRGPLRIMLREGEEAEVTVVVANGSSVRDARIEKAIDAMKSDPARRWTIEDLAAIAGLSRAAFVRRFRRETSTSPVRFLTELRMRLAVDRLAISNEALATIASWIGYESEFAFARAFKRRYGVAPGQYRRATPTLALAA